MCQLPIQVVGWKEEHLHMSYMLLRGNEAIDWNLSYEQAVDAVENCRKLGHWEVTMREQT